MDAHKDPELYDVGSDDSDEHDEPHKAEPKRGTWRRKSDGQKTDLYVKEDYPILADCLYCEQTIEAEGFFSAFVHVSE